MSILTIDELERELKRGLFHPAYLLLGPEEYLRRRALIKLKTSLAQGAALDFDWDELGGAKLPAGRLMGALRTLPVISPRRIVLLRDLDDLEAETQGALLSYLDAPNPKSTLLMEADDLDRRTSLFKALREKSQVVEFPKLKGYALKVWLEDYIRQEGRTISSSTLGRLVDLAGSDLQALMAEVDKLLLYLGDEKVIHPQAIDQLVHGSRRHTVFELTDALGCKDKQAALRSLTNLLDSGAEPLVVLHMVARHFRQVLIAKEMLRSGHAAREIGQAVQVPAFVLDKFLRQARSLDQGVAERVYTRLATIDFRMKSTSTSERILLESLIHSLPGQEPVREL